MEEKQLRDYKVIYIIGITHAILHLIVGIIWENVELPQGNSALLSLPHFGGELALVGICLLLVFFYFALGLRREPDVPIHIRRFCLTLSFVVALGSLVLMVVMSIRTNDYRKEKDAIARQAYYGAVILTVSDILTTIFFLPSYIYLAACNYRLVKEEELRVKEKDSKTLEGEQQKRENRRSPEVEQNQEADIPFSDRHLQQIQVQIRTQPEEDQAILGSPLQQHKAHSETTSKQRQDCPEGTASINEDNPTSPVSNPTAQSLDDGELLSAAVAAY